MGPLRRNPRFGATPERGPSAAEAAELARLERLAALLDAKWRIPGLGLRFGWDAIAGLVPGFGDAVAAAPSAWMIYRAHALGAPRGVLVRMAFNTGVDFALGSVPFAGNVFDVFFKANLRNAALFREHLRRTSAPD